MTLPVSFRTTARAEVREAMEWYAANLAGLAEQFVTELDRVVVRIAEGPQQFPAVFKDIRRARLRRFPYALFFRIKSDGLHVLACYHSSRNPLRWQGRH